MLLLTGPALATYRMLPPLAPILPRSARPMKAASEGESGHGRRLIRGARQVARPAGSGARKRDSTAEHS